MLDTLFRLAAAPLLIAQAIAVRRRAQSLPEAAGPRHGTLGNGPPLRLRIIGDSSAAGVGATTQAEALAGQLATLLAETFTVTWTLDAITGATTASTLTRLSDSPPEPTDVIVIALGVNDVTRLIPRKTWLRRQHRLLARLHSLYQPHHIYLSGMPPLAHFPLLPNPLRWTLARHARVLETTQKALLEPFPDTTIVPFVLDPNPQYMAADGFHPAPPLYTLWAKEMASRIRSDWPSCQTR